MVHCRNGFLATRTKPQLNNIHETHTTTIARSYLHKESKTRSQTSINDACTRQIIRTTNNQTNRHHRRHKRSNEKVAPLETTSYTTPTTHNTTTNRTKYARKMDKATTFTPVTTMESFPTHVQLRRTYTNHTLVTTFRCITIWNDQTTHPYLRKDHTHRTRDPTFQPHQLQQLPDHPG